MNKPRPYSTDKRSPSPINEARSRIMSSIKSKNTKPELFLRKNLWNHDIKGYRLHWKKIPGKPDIVFVSKKLAIFVNGCFWHRCPKCNPSTPKHNFEFWEIKFKRTIERDALKSMALKNLGWRVMTIWECDLNRDVEKIVDKIRNILNE